MRNICCILAELKINYTKTSPRPWIPLYPHPTDFSEHYQRTCTCNNIKKHIKSWLVMLQATNSTIRWLVTSESYCRQVLTHQQLLQIRAGVQEGPAPTKWIHCLCLQKKIKNKTFFLSVGEYMFELLFHFILPLNAAYCSIYIIFCLMLVQQQIMSSSRRFVRFGFAARDLRQTQRWCSQHHRNYR